MAGLAGCNAFCVGREDREVLVPAVRQFAGHDSLPLLGQHGVLFRPGLVLGGPLDLRLAAALHGLAQVALRLFGNQELCVFGPAVEALGGFDFLHTQGLAVGGALVLLVGRAVSDVAVHDDQCGPVGLRLRFADRRFDLVQIVGVLHLQHIPVIALEARFHVVAVGPRGWPVQADVVGVVEPDEVGELEMSGQRRYLVRDALHQVAIRADGVDAVIDDLVLAPIEVGRKPALGDGHADGVCDALSQGPRRGLDTGREVVLGMARALRAQLAKALDFGEREIVSGQVQHGIEQHGSVSGGEKHAVAVRPMRVRGAMPEEAVPEHVSHRGQPHGSARMSAIRLLDGINGESSDGIDAELVDCRGIGGCELLHIG